MNNPQVIEKIGKTEKVSDLDSKLLHDRIIYLSDDVTQETANAVIKKILWLSSVSSEEPINLYINSAGGDVEQALAIKDVMYHITCKVNTIGLGKCCSMGAYLLAAGTGERRAMKNCNIMIHSIYTGFQGMYHDVNIAYERSKYLQDTLMLDISSFTKGKMSASDVKVKTARDCYLSSNEAKALGLIDIVLYK